MLLSYDPCRDQHLWLPWEALEAKLNLVSGQIARQALRPQILLCQPHDECLLLYTGSVCLPPVALQIAYTGREPSRYAPLYKAGLTYTNEVGRPIEWNMSLLEVDPPHGWAAWRPE
jgi:hypothetical protein